MSRTGVFFLRALPPGSWRGHGLAGLAFLAALALRWGLDGSLPPGFPYLTFFPAVILTSFIAGTGPGVLCAGLCGLAAWYWFIPPYDSFGLTGNTALALGFYVFIVGVDIAIIHAMRRAGARLAAERELSAALAERQRTLFAELQHRAANNLAFIGALLALNREQVAADPAAAPAVFDEAVRRLEVIGRLHRLLHDPAALDRPLEEYLRTLCADLLDAAGAGGIACRVEAADIRFDLGRLTTLSLLLTELITNSLKHAFRGRSGGLVAVTLGRLPSGRLELTVADDGPGMPARGTGPGGGSLGLVIADALARQLQGELILPAPGDSTTRLLFDP